jgi:3-hydroxy-3-methylglutaryl CoA synthase
MAVEASIDCLAGVDRKLVDGFFLASTSLPYKEKMVSTIGAQTLDLRRDTRTADFASSLRAGTTALLSAMDAVNAGSRKNVLVAAADTRETQANGPLEVTLGDGGAALMVGDNGVIATIEGTYSISDEFTDLYRGYNDHFLRAWEDRFMREEGYERVIPEAVKGLLEKCNLTAKDIAKAAYYGPDARVHGRIGRLCGLTPEQVQDPLFMNVGNTGTAVPLMALVGALEEAKPGDKILVVGYGNGADAILLKVTDEITKVGARRGVKGYLSSKRQIPGYDRYLIWRDLTPQAPQPRPEISPTSASAMWREAKQNLSLYGSKCKVCGSQFYPPQRICVKCHSKDEYDFVRISDKKATVFSFTNDFLALSLDPPTTVCYVDIDGGGRYNFDMTDRDPNEVKVGMPVEFTFRRLYYDRGISNYWWKIRPMRGG